jgi:GNAT superfamily N-acetyltransferase
MQRSEVVVRRAGHDVADQLTELALRSKASWGYSDQFMEACRDELTMTAARLAKWEVWVAIFAGALAGTIALGQHADPTRAELEYLFVEPRFQGRGIGAALFDKLIEICTDRGVVLLGVDADPNAESIYRHFRFRTVGRSPSGSITGRTLPRMELRLTEISTP